MKILVGISTELLCISRLPFRLKHVHIVLLVRLIACNAMDTIYKERGIKLDSHHFMILIKC